MEKYSVYYLEDKEWKLLLSGLDKEGAENHSKMYSSLFKTDTMIKREGL